MTDLEAFSAIMELNRKHKLGFEPDGWEYKSTKWKDPDFGSLVDPGWYRINGGGPGACGYTDTEFPWDLDLQALTATASAWLESEHGIIIRRWLGGYAPFVDGEQNDRHTEHVPMHSKGYRKPTRLLAIHAAIEHVTEPKKGDSDE